MKAFAFFTAAVLLGAVPAPSPAQTARVAPPPEPVTGNPAAASIKPLVNGQPQRLGSQRGDYTLTRITDGLANPWSVAFLPDGDFLVTERGGNLRRVTPAGVISDPIAGIPVVAAKGHGGLLDVILSPRFASDQTIYLAYSEDSDGKDPLGDVVISARLDGDALRDVKTIYRQFPKLARSPYWQFGGRLLFDKAGHLFITQGDNNVPFASQELDKHIGKIVRIWPDGSVPKDNPFVGKPGALPEIWSLGHRNVEGAGFHPVTGELWATEHGQRGGDELNIARPARNYGWPIITYGVNYDAQTLSLTEGTAKKGLEQPIYHWARSPALSGLAFATAPSAWKGDLFLGGLADRQLIRLTLDGNKVVGEERLLSHLNQRIRDVRQGPDGALYVLTDAFKGALLKLEPPRR